ncbi:efflux RND transporter periplasmic adaptor subunit [Clostridium sp. MCC328]|uniref:efflux RND transporter periplasmic adaptor subunit n=1 Tax=Clostridium sp. MCC328 TaxID=2592642 RepID=UPI002079446D|nr:efflux RND transporter periplasmic adaptor subunit [Clostridium sp. MCC328]
MENEKVAAEKKRKKRKGKSGRIVIVLIVVLAVLLGGFFLYKKKTTSQKRQGDQSVSTATVKRTDISSELTASSALSPKDTYEVTSLVEGEVIEANFEEGDVVEKGQVLYRIDASSMDSDLSSAETSLQRAKESAQTAQSNYAEETARIAGNTYRSTASGYIKTLYIKEGDKVNNGTKIADLYDDSVMKITVPFLSGEAAEINVGDEAAVTLEDTGEKISGTVTIVSSMEETLSGGRLVKNVTVEVSNPGGLTTDTAASVTVDGFVCSAEGTFAAKTETTLSVEISGNKSLEIENLLIHEGSYVEKNSELFQVTTKTAEEYLKEFKDAVESADDNLENAENKLSNTQDSVDDYTITAPISGTVITKNVKVGDKISKSSSGTTTMAVIYDLSTMTLEMSVDELDVSSVKVGQSVEITADAVEGETFTGTVTNVSLQSSYSNGVTNYPVTVTLDDTGSLLPGMNVDAKIILDSSEDALVIPASALMRGNRVYVKKSSDSTENADTQRNDSSDNVGDADSERKNHGDGTLNADSVDRQPDAGAEASGSSKGSGTDNSSSKSNGSGKSGSSNVPDGFEAVQVTTGIINDDYVEILSGLSEGDEVYISSDSGSSTQTNQMQMGGMGGPGGDMGGGVPGGPGGNGGNGGGNGSGRRSQ